MLDYGHLVPNHVLPAMSHRCTRARHEVSPFGSAVNHPGLDQTPLDPASSCCRWQCWHCGPAREELAAKTDAHLLPLALAGAV
jgi:hypothetical protein